MNGFLFMKLSDDELWSISYKGCNFPDTDEDLDKEQPVLLFNGAKAYHKGDGWYDIIGYHPQGKDVDEVWAKLESRK